MAQSFKTFRSLSLFTLFVLAGAFFPTETRADTLVVASGSGQSNSSGLTLTVSNADGTAQLTAAIGRGASLTNPFDACLSRPCSGGSTMSLSWSAFGSDVRGGASVINGQSFSSSYGGGSSFSVSASLVIPGDGAASYRLVVPFTATAHLNVYTAGGSCCQPPQYVYDFMAEGFATVILTRGSNGNYLPTSVTYQITTPTPEPMTMLLLGTGLAGVAAGVRRRRGNQRR